MAVLSKTEDAAVPGAAVMPWWRERMMWLVIGAPAAVVVASFVTLAIALSHPDPVLATGTDVERSAAPAVQARNNGAAPQR